MGRQFMFGTVMAAAITVGLGAQSYPPEGNKPQSTTQGKEKPARETGRGQAVTLVGCLQSGDQSTSGAPTGTAGSTASDRGARSSQFVLIDATESSTGKAGAGATGTAGTTATPTSIPSTLKLTASGNSSASWSKYLNHKVEVKGTLQEHAMGGMEPNPTGNPPSANPANPPATNPANPPSANPEQPPTPGATTSSSDMGPTLRVTSIKEVAATCSATK